jgi:DNA-binding NarL/FixJ family response regulator
MGERMQKVQVLVADDHEVVRVGIRKALSKFSHFKISGEAGDGPSLFQLLATATPDLLIIDVSMPGFDPLPAVRQIRTQYPTTKILVVSAFDDDMYVEGLLGAGIDGYYLKGEPLSDLLVAVERVLDGKRWISDSLLGRLIPGSQAERRPARLTRRQIEVLQLLQQGLDNAAIAQRLGLSVKTVENHLTRLYRQLNLQSRAEAISYAFQNADALCSTRRGKTCTRTAPSTEFPGPIAVLVVDDNPRYRTQIRTMIGKVCPAATVWEAQDVAEAIGVMHRVKPKVVLLDVILGNENGIQGARRLHAACPDNQIVLISAYPDREFHRLALEAGAVAFVDKTDIDASTLQHILDNARV